jgi:NAD(P)H-nitrite reductase large subunit
VSTTAAQCCYDPTTGGFTGTCNSGTATYLSTANCTKATSSCGGGDSLMFYLLGNESAGTVSAQQGAIIRANPVVY